MRLKLIDAVIFNRSTVASACREIGIKLTTGCLIIRNYKKEGRIFQKPGSTKLDYPPVSGREESKKKRIPTRNERYKARTESKAKIEEVK